MVVNENRTPLQQSSEQDRRTLHPVARLLLERQKANSQPNSRTDGRIVALAIEGGGMRGVVSAGMVGALEQLGLLNSFDVVYGASAGAISAAYFVARQARYGTTIFYDNINNRHFIDLRRIFTNAPVLSLEFLLDHVCKTEKPLAVERVLQSPIPLRVLSASISKLSSVTMRNFTDERSLFDALRGSARIPFFAGPPVEYLGDRLLDAALYQSIPFKAAVADGATDVVVLLTRPAGVLRPRPNLVDRFLVAPYLGRLAKDLTSHYLGRAEQYQQELHDIQSHDSRTEGLCSMLIQIEGSDAEVGPFETARNKLVRGAMDGNRAVYKALDMAVPQFVETIMPYPRSV